MIVYSHREERIVPRAAFEQLRRAVESSAAGASGSHDAVVELLVSCGGLEASICDVLHPDDAEGGLLAARWRRVSIALGAAVVRSWHGDRDGCSRALQAARAAVADIDADALPPEAAHRVEEGFAYHAVYPESYHAAAVEFWRELRPHRVVCLGIRTIGAALSAVVAATLTECGSQVESLTERPRGHPFDRTLAVSGRLRRALARDAPFVAIVDEGPGQSGSTFAGVAAALLHIGIPRDRVVLFPSRSVDPGSLRSSSARALWPQLKKYVGGFERVRPVSHAVLGGEPLTDLSAGAWRQRVLGGEQQFPPVHPAHERRKYLVSGGRAGLWRFCGLGPYGSAAFDRARSLAERGFAAPARSLRSGFLLLDWLDGVPLGRSPVITTPLIDRIASYLAHLRSAQACTQAATPDTLREMIRLNLAEALGGAYVARHAATFEGRVPEAAAIRLDGRMLPHEWIENNGRFFKADALDHHCDDFYPGSHDIAWDVAAVPIEFAMPDGSAAAFVDLYRRRSGDRTIAARLPFYRLAYLAYRIGYTTTAQRQLAGTPDGARFERETARYRGALLREPSSAGI